MKCIQLSVLGNKKFNIFMLIRMHTNDIITYLPVEINCMHLSILKFLKQEKFFHFQLKNMKKKKKQLLSFL